MTIEIISEANFFIIILGLMLNYGTLMGIAAHPMNG
jgi:hypothetical protein